MELPLTRVSSCELRSVIRFFAVDGETAAAIHKNLVSVYGAQCMSEGVVRQWVQDFHVGRDEVYDLPREGRPKDSLTSDVITGIRSLLEDRRLTIRQIEYTMHEEMCIPTSRATVHQMKCKNTNGEILCRVHRQHCKNCRFVARKSGKQQYDDDGATIDTRVQLQTSFYYTFFCCAWGNCHSNA